MTPAAVARAAVVGMAVALLAGCGTTSAPQAPSPGITTGGGVFTAPDDSAAINNTSTDAPTSGLVGLEVRRKTWGGMCATGPCGSSLVIFGSGAWVLMTEGAHTQGAIPPADLVALSQAVRTTRLDKARGVADCAADHDGTSVAYSWTSGGVTRSASSCDQPIDPADPLAVELERLAAAIVP